LNNYNHHNYQWIPLPLIPSHEGRGEVESSFSKGGCSGITGSIAATKSPLASLLQRGGVTGIVLLALSLFFIISLPSMGADDTTRCINLYKEGLTLEVQGKWERAIEVLTEASKINCFISYRIFNALGWAYYNIRDVEGAISWITRSISQEPRYEDANLNLVRIYNLEERYEKAIETGTKALDRYKLENSHEIANEIAYAYLKLDKPDEAEAWLKRAIRMNEFYITAYKNLISLYNRLGKYNEGIEEGESAITLILSRPREEKITDELETVEVAKEEAPRAGVQLKGEDLLELAGLHNEVAVSHFRLGDQEAAEKHLRQALDSLNRLLYLNPDNAKAKDVKDLVLQNLERIR
jgi:tetratricopeptide (TPR) repeat protein